MTVLVQKPIDVIQDITIHFHNLTYIKIEYDIKTNQYFENSILKLILPLEILQELYKSWTRLEESLVNLHSSTSWFITVLETIITTYRTQSQGVKVCMLNCLTLILIRVVRLFVISVSHVKNDLCMEVNKDKSYAKFKVREANINLVNEELCW